MREVPLNPPTAPRTFPGAGATHSPQQRGSSPVWRPGELGGPGGRLQTISIIPSGRRLQMATPSKRARCLAPQLTPSQAADLYTGRPGLGPWLLLPFEAPGAVCCPRICDAAQGMRLGGWGACTACRSTGLLGRATHAAPDRTAVQLAMCLQVLDRAAVRAAAGAQVAPWPSHAEACRHLVWAHGYMTCRQL